MISIKLEGHIAFHKKMLRVITGVRPSVATVNRRYLAILKREAMASASGRPGPEVQTGAFRNNMQTELAEGGVVLTNPSPQAARLEYGFIGVDTLGRHYSQSPYPWLRPTYDRVAPMYVKDLDISMKDLIND